MEEIFVYEVNHSLLTYEIESSRRDFFVLWTIEDLLLFWEKQKVGCRTLMWIIFLDWNLLSFR